MRLAVVTADWPGTTGGGVAALTSTLADGLSAAGHDVEVWTRGGGRRDALLRTEDRGYPVRGLPGRAWRRRGDVHWSRGLPALLAAFRPDAAIVSTWDPLPGALGPLSTLGRPLRVFAHGRDITGDPGADRRDARAAALRGPHRWFCLTAWMTAQLTSRGVAPSRVLRVPAAVPGPSVDGPRRPEPGQLLSVGRLVPRKGQDALLGAVAQLPAHVRLDVVGEGPDRARLARLVESLGLGDRVRLHGHVPRPRLEELWSRAALFALPVRDEPEGDAEGYGLVFLEAAARGLPAVGGRVSGAAEAIVHGETGLLVDAPEDSEQVALALRSLLDDAPTAAAMGARGRERWLAVGQPEALAGAVFRDLEENR